MAGLCRFVGGAHVHSIWIDDKQLAAALRRNQAFWQNTLEDYPLMWLTVPHAKPGRPPREPDSEEKLWTDIDYRLAAAEFDLAHTYYAGDALPVFVPFLGPDQFAAWLGADMTLSPRTFTSWSKPFLDDWSQIPELRIDPDNRWWKLYLETLNASVQAGKDKWITGYPDLHTGIDALAAIRGPEKLMLDMLEQPQLIHRAMQQTTQLFKNIVDTVSDAILPTGQGTSNWTMGWSSGRFLCVGQNDFSCLISPEMFIEFCLEDTVQCCDHVDYSLYHLDGPGAIRHLPALLQIESLTAVQWIHGDGQPPSSQWVPLLRQIQDAGKAVQVWYPLAYNIANHIDLCREIDVLCANLDPTRLFVCAELPSLEQAHAALERARQASLTRRPPFVPTNTPKNRIATSPQP